jgi:hypothetical protein
MRGSLNDAASGIMTSPVRLSSDITSLRTKKRGITRRNYLHRNPHLRQTEIQFEPLDLRKPNMTIGDTGAREGAAHRAI